MHFETKAIQSTLAKDKSGAVVPALVLSTTFERQPDGSYPDGYVYSRAQNPNRAQLEASMAQLESGTKALAFASGMAAIGALFQSLGAGAHIILPHQAYYSTILLAEEVFSAWGLQYTCVDMTHVNAISSAIQNNTKLIWIESPSNPTLSITDIKAVVGLAQAKNIIIAVDNTWATPVWQQPLLLGAHVVMHSSSKYIGGHSDVLSGALVFAKDNDLYQKVHNIQKLMGAVPSAFDCWLLLRGIKTLSLRVKAQSQTAALVAQFLSTHPKVEKVFYPGLISHLGHSIAKTQMGGFGAMLSINLQANEATSLAFTGLTKLFTAATSLGGVESLIEHRRSVEGSKSISPHNLLRLSIGLEHPADLIADLKQALNQL
jgi:cystathionine gamma-synthase